MVRDSSWKVAGSNFPGTPEREGTRDLPCGPQKSSRWLRLANECRWPLRRGLRGGSGNMGKAEGLSGARAGRRAGPPTPVHVQTQGSWRCPRVSVNSPGSWLLRSPESLKIVILSDAAAFRPSALWASFPNIDVRSVHSSRRHRQEVWCHGRGFTANPLLLSAPAPPFQLAFSLSLLDTENMSCSVLISVNPHTSWTFFFFFFSWET